MEKSMMKSSTTRTGPTRTKSAVATHLKDPRPKTAFGDVRSGRFLSPRSPNTIPEVAVDLGRCKNDDYMRHVSVQKMTNRLLASSIDDWMESGDNLNKLVKDFHSKKMRPKSSSSTLSKEKGAESPKEVEPSHRWKSAFAAITFQSRLNALTLQQSRRSVTEKTPQICVDGWFGFVESINFLDIYKNIGRRIAPTTEIVVMCCQYSHNKELLACGLSNGAVEVLCEKGSTTDAGKLEYQTTLLGNDEKEGSSTVLSGSAQVSCEKSTVLTDVGKLEYHTTLQDDDVKEESANCLCIQWLSKSEILACYANGFVKVWSLKEKKATVSIDEKKGQITPSWCLSKLPQRQVMCCAATSRNVLTGGSDGVIRVYAWSYEDGEKHLVHQHSCQHLGNKESMDGHSQRIFMLRFDPHQSLFFYSGGWDDAIFKWDIRSTKALFHIETPIMCSNECLDIDSDGKLYIGAHCQAAIHVYVPTDGTLIPKAVLRLPKDKLTLPYIVKCFGNDKLLVGGTNRNALYLIDKKIAGNIELPVQSSVENLSGAVTSVDFGKEEGSSKRYIIALASGSCVHLINCSKRS